MSDISTEFSQQFPLAATDLAYLTSNGFIDEKKAERQMKKALSGDDDDMEEAFEWIKDKHTLHYKKPKKSVLTPEQIEEAKQKRLLDYINSLTMWAKGDDAMFKGRLSEFNFPEEHILCKNHFAKLRKAAEKMGLEIILTELEKLSTNTKTKTAVLRKDGTIGAAVKYYLNCEKYKYHPDGTPYEISVMDVRGKKINGVLLDFKDKVDNSEKYVIEGYDDPDEYCSLEKIGGKKTNEDGLSQYRKTPLTFPNPEWKGEGFCRGITTNKKFYERVHKENGGDWERVKFENPPIFCCNGELKGNATACATHTKNKKVDWTSLGAGWTSKRME